MRKISAFFPHLISIVSGIALWIVIPAITGNPEAWGVPIYYYGGMPLITIECLFLGYFYPARNWQWSLEVTLSQAVFLSFKWPSSNLLPMGFMFLAVLSIPYFLGSYVGALLRRRFGKHESVNA